MQFLHAFQTDIGRRRKQNQDNGACVPESGLFVVADGMGGHQGGETASAMVAEIVPKCVRQEQKKKNWNAGEVVAKAIREANAAIFKRSHQDAKLEGMGTTTTALLFQRNHLYIGHVGDSRCYFFRPGALWQLTRDHSLVEEKLRAGIISRDQAKTDQFKNVITRSVGFESEVDVDLYEVPLQVGDVFLICSDGLTGPVENEEMMKIVQEELFTKGKLDMAAKRLVDTANHNGGDDNITVLMIQVKDL